MPLHAALFQNDPKLEAAAASDPAHIIPGARGEHVRKIQLALNTLDGATLKADGIYGPATAGAVLAFKKKRNIVNRTYQTAPDNIVGKMTIAAMDSELVGLEPPTARTCALFLACPADVPGRPAASAGPRLAFSIGAGAVGADAGAPSSDTDRMNEALRFARQCLRDARGDLMSLTNALRNNTPLVEAQEKAFTAAITWLNLDRNDKAACVRHLDKATDLMLRNLNVKTSTGGEITLTRVPGATYHGLTHLNSPDLGMKFGDPFFGVDGPNCRRDVVVHEFFHLLGVKHGGGALMGPTIRSAITTPDQALNSADNLAQLVAQLRTFKSPNTDACARAGD